VDFLKALSDLKNGLPEGTDTSQIDAIRQAFEPYQGLDPVVTREAIASKASRTATDAQMQALQAERDRFQADLTQYQNTNAQLSKELAATRGLTKAGVRPEYEELLLSKATGSLELGEDGAATAPEGFWDGLKTQYPAMFFAEDGAGTGAAPGASAADDSPRAVKATNGLVTGLDPDEVLNGKVTVQL
jgi:hypothetical protein